MTATTAESLRRRTFGISAYEWRDGLRDLAGVAAHGGVLRLAGGAGASATRRDALQPLRRTGAFFDVTKGGNGYCAGESSPYRVSQQRNADRMDEPNPGRTTTRLRRHPACNAAPGFDGPTGVGCPKGLYGLRADDFTAVTQTSATSSPASTPTRSNVTECKFEFGTRPATAERQCKALPGSGEKPVLVSTRRPASPPAPNTTSGSHDQRQRHVPGTRHHAPHANVTAPSVETKGTTGVSASSATLYASVNPRGSSVSTCKFEYGTTTGYGRASPAHRCRGPGRARWPWTRRSPPGWRQTRNTTTGSPLPTRAGRAKAGTRRLRRRREPATDSVRGQGEHMFDDPSRNRTPERCAAGRLPAVPGRDQGPDRGRTDPCRARGQQRADPAVLGDWQRDPDARAA